MASYAEKIWGFLNLPHKSKLDLDTHIREENLKSDLSFDYINLLKEFQSTENLRIISLKKKTAEDIAYLTSLGLSIDHLLANFRKRVGLVTHDNRQFQDRAVISGNAYAVCPITGGILCSNQAIPVTLSVVFHRFVGAKVFYLVTGNIGVGYAKDALYFPEYELAIRYESHRYGFQKSHVTILKAILVTYYKEFLNYFADSTSKKVAVLIGHTNFAHHLWNELSALHRLKKKNALRKIAKIFVIREPLGPLSEIFPELSRDKIQHIDYFLSLNPDEFSFLNNIKPIDIQTISDILKNNYCFINIGDTFIPHQLTRQIHWVSQKQVSQEIQNKIIQAKNQCFPLLWISIRTQNRTWVKQTEGLINVINSLSKKFPNLGIVFDGFTLPLDSISQDSRHSLSSKDLQIIAQEKKVVTEIVDNISSNILTFNTIGLSMSEANLWAHAVDLYLCHFGTLQHKIGWLTLKPGIVHCNARISANRKAQFRCYGVREFGIPPKFIDSSKITTVPVTMAQNNLQSNIDNYDIDWKIMDDKLSKLIASVEKSKTVQAKIINSFDFSRKYLKSKLSAMPYLRRYIKNR